MGLDMCLLSFKLSHFYAVVIFNDFHFASKLGKKLGDIASTLSVCPSIGLSITQYTL